MRKEVEENQLISPANYSALEGDVELVQHYANVDARKCLEPGVAGERYKPVCSVNRALIKAPSPPPPTPTNEGDKGLGLTNIASFCRGRVFHCFLTTVQGEAVWSHISTTLGHLKPQVSLYTNIQLGGLGGSSEKLLLYSGIEPGSILRWLFNYPVHSSLKESTIATPFTLDCHIANLIASTPQIFGCQPQIVIILIPHLMITNNFFFL